jgi:hypothetical protein
MKVTRTERGWPGHLCVANSCMFRRNTLIECGDRRIVVSTVGNYIYQEKIKTIGHLRYYETMAFEAVLEGPYWDANVSEEVNFQSPWAIRADSVEELPDDVDNLADEMHEAVVAELMKKIKGVKR